MKHTLFMTLVRDRQEMCRAILEEKTREYSREGDCLNTVRRSARFFNVHPAQAALQGLMKHMVSLADQVDDLDRGVDHSERQWNEKLNDAHNYLHIIEAAVKEKSHGTTHAASATSVIV